VTPATATIPANSRTASVSIATTVVTATTNVGDHGLPRGNDPHHHVGY
jgi:hypothetical protein